MMPLVVPGRGEPWKSNIPEYCPSLMENGMENWEPQVCQCFVLLKFYIMHCSNLFDFNDREEETCHFSVISHMPLATSFEKIMIYKPPAVWQMLKYWHVLGMWCGRYLRGLIAH